MDYPIKQPEKKLHKVAQQRSMGGAEALELGQEINAELKAQDDLEHFFDTTVWKAYEAVKTSMEPKIKGPKWEAVQKRFEEIKVLADKNPKNEKVIRAVQAIIDQETKHA